VAGRGLHRRLRPAVPGDGADRLEPLDSLRLVGMLLTLPGVITKFAQRRVPDPVTAKKVAFIRRQYSPPYGSATSYVCRTHLPSGCAAVGIAASSIVAMVAAAPSRT